MNGSAALASGPVVGTLVVIALAFGACGGRTAISPPDGGGDGPRSSDAAAARGDGAPAIHTAVEGTRPLNMLTPMEAEKVCAATTMYARELFMQERVNDMVCRLAGLVALALAPDDQVQAACAQGYNACKSVPPNNTPLMPMCGMADPRCMATVAELEACLNALPMDLQLLDRLLPPCERATKLSLAPLAAGGNLLGPACRTLDMKCPGAVGGLSGPLGGNRP